MNARNALVLAGVTLAIAACNRPDTNRTTSTPSGVNNPTAVSAPIVTPSAPPAPAERGPVPANANTMAPGTDAAVAFADASPAAIAKLPPSKSGPDAPNVVSAQQAAAQSPDTATADAAKKEAMGAKPDSAGAAPAGPTARDTAANSPRHGNLTPREESTQMPKAGSVNNHSSPALEKDSGSSPPR